MLKSVKVRDWMTANVLTLSPQMEMLRAIHLLVENRISGAPVVDDHGALVGILSEKDCMQVALGSAYHGDYGGQVREYMNRDVRTVDVHASVLDVAGAFNSAPYRRYPVLDGNRLVGQISRRDVLRALIALW